MFYTKKNKKGFTPALIFKKSIFLSRNNNLKLVRGFTHTLNLVSLLVFLNNTLKKFIYSLVNYFSYLELNSNKNTKPKLVRGFTLVEIMVSVSVFAVVMLFVSSSIYGVFDSNRKSQSLRSVMDNLGFSLETMTRTIRFGSRYHCDTSVGSLSTTRDCAGGASSIAVLDSNNNQVVFRLSNGRIVRSINGGTEYYVTGGDVTITSLSFRVFGSATYSGSGDLFQPQVIIVVSGYSGSKVTSRSSFNLQTTISQRLFDSQ